MFIAQRHLSFDWSALRRDVKRRIKSLPFVAWLQLARHRRRYFDKSIDDVAGHPYFGCFRSFEEARAWLPPSKEFDTTALADEYVSVRTHRIFAYDYPAIYWLERAFRGDANRILDIGGSVGVHFKAYRHYLRYPRNIHWDVIEVPTIARLGAQLARREGLHELSFSDSLAEVDREADVWLSAGAIHYVEQGSIPNLLDQVASPPRYIILNKLPLYDGADFVTTQRLAPGLYSPLHVYGREGFIAGIAAAGYELVDQWDVPERSFYLPGHEDKSFDWFTGLCFRRRW